MFYKRLANFKIHLFLFLALPYILCARPVETFYGPIEVQEPVLLELIDSPLFQRLKDIHQYGVAYFISHKEEYNRYDHSIGVFAILRKNEASLEEQIAGLLHDVSHTTFSHVGDWIFGKENQEDDYQGNIHASFLEKTGLGDILKKYNLTIDQVRPDEDLFPALESPLPNLCADRIDYNIQGAYYQGFITYEEALLIFKDLCFINNQWISQKPDLMKKLTRFSLFMTQDCWGGPTNYMTSRWLADAILRAIDLKIISYADLHYGIDQEIWATLLLQKDPIIEKNMDRVINSQAYFSVVDFGNPCDFLIKSKFRGINPSVASGSTYLPITAIDEELAKEYEAVQKKFDQGWPIKMAN